MKNVTALLMLLAMSILAPAFTAPEVSAPGRWEKLGSRKVNYRLDRDVIHLGVAERTFTRLKIQITGGSVHMHRMIVEYRNGQKETIPLKHHFRRGTDSRVIDLEGRRRIIKDITFWYDSANLSPTRATIHVFGKH
jgi:hypothetical protein